MKISKESGVTKYSVSEHEIEYLQNRIRQLELKITELNSEIKYLKFRIRMENGRRK